MERSESDQTALGLLFLKIWKRKEKTKDKRSKIRALSNHAREEAGKDIYKKPALKPREIKPQQSPKFLGSLGERASTLGKVKFKNGFKRASRKKAIAHPAHFPALPPISQTAGRRYKTAVRAAQVRDILKNLLAAFILRPPFATFNYVNLVL